MSKLYVTATPIGNYGDITLRAVEILREVDFVICEEFKEARRLFARLGFSPKELVSLNEHNEKENAPEYISAMKKGKNAALISDGGTPVFSDPGNYLINLAYRNGIDVVPLPGANSVIAALSVSGFNLNSFYFAGWLPTKKDARKKRLQEISSIKELIILMETPYRLRKLVSECARTFGGKRQAVLAYNLTLPDEKIFRDNLQRIAKLSEEKKLKGEFVLIIDNKK
jgi:16S rRNA (cytidine1402-2'-O)-methyltransferase